MKVGIQIVLWIVIVFLGWMLWGSIMGPIEFNKVKEARYIKVIKTLKDIQAAELAHKEITGQFTGSFDSLISFLDTAQFAITQRRDTSYADVERNKAYGITEGYFKNEIIVDTLGFTMVKDSLYGGSDRYKQMRKVPVEGVDAEFELRAGNLVRNEVPYSVFEVRVAKEVVLHDLDKDLLAQEKQLQSVEGIRGEYIQVGSMNDVNTTGNWSKIYDSAQ